MSVEFKTRRCSTTGGSYIVTYFTKEIVKLIAIIYVLKDA